MRPARKTRLRVSLKTQNSEKEGGSAELAYLNQFLNHCWIADALGRLDLFVALGRLDKEHRGALPIACAVLEVHAMR